MPNKIIQIEERELKKEQHIQHARISGIYPRHLPPNCFREGAEFGKVNVIKSRIK